MTEIIADSPKALEPGKWKAGTASPLHMHLQALARTVGGYAYRYSNETRLHELMGQVLLEAGVEHVREHILDQKNRADFFLPPSGIVIEVKVDGSFSEAMRQVDRYLHLDAVKGVLLASTQRWADDRLKDRLSWQEKPFLMVRLRRQTL